jgi:hypothetical protein
MWSQGRTFFSIAGSSNLIPIQRSAATRVATCAETDIDALEHHLPSGRNDAHAHHFARRQAGEAEYLIAWVDDVPVGHVR